MRSVSNYLLTNLNMSVNNYDKTSQRGNFYRSNQPVK
ncbi:hypothetical protein BH160DRAFT_4697 [Burkholderia sp. H160]|nr:hypothetical protein BH160DRAFT_4697 [Burkholderia sp. H160]